MPARDSKAADACARVGGVGVRRVGAAPKVRRPRGKGARARTWKASVEKALAR